MNWQSHKKKTCPVCKEEFPYVDIKNPPATCGKKMCNTNYNAHLGRMTPQGDSPTLERLAEWPPKNLKE